METAKVLYNGELSLPYEPIGASGLKNKDHDESAAFQFKNNFTSNCYKTLILETAQMVGI